MCSRWSRVTSHVNPLLFNRLIGRIHCIKKKKASLPPPIERTNGQIHTQTSTKFNSTLSNLSSTVTYVRL